MRRPMFERKRRGPVIVRLYPQEAELLALTVNDMVAVVDEPPDDNIRDRLYPRAYLDPTEESAQADYDALVRGDLRDARRAAFAAIAAQIAGAPTNRAGLLEFELPPDGELQWLTAINDARLAVGTALGVGPDEDTEYAPDDPRFEFGVLYGFLTQIHVELTELLLDELGSGGTDDPGEAGAAG